MIVRRLSDEFSCLILSAKAEKNPSLLITDRDDSSNSKNNSWREDEEDKFSKNDSKY